MPPPTCPPSSSSSVPAAGGQDETCSGNATCGLINPCFVFVRFPLAISSVCGLIGGGRLPAASTPSSPAASSALGCLFALGEAISRTQLLFPAAAATSCSAERRGNPWQSPAWCSWPPPSLNPPSRGSWKSPALPQTASAIALRAPDPLHLLKAGTSAASPPAWPPETPRVVFPPFLLSVVFLIAQWSTLCLQALGSLPGSWAWFCLCLQRKRETAAELSPTAGPGSRELAGASGMEGKGLVLGVLLALPPGVPFPICISSCQGHRTGPGV